MGTSKAPIISIEKTNKFQKQKRQFKKIYSWAQT